MVSKQRVITKISRRRRARGGGQSKRRKQRGGENILKALSNDRWGDALGEIAGNSDVKGIGKLMGFGRSKSMPQMQTRQPNQNQSNRTGFIDGLRSMSDATKIGRNILTSNSPQQTNVVLQEALRKFGPQFGLSQNDSNIVSGFLDRRPTDPRQRGDIRYWADAMQGAIDQSIGQPTLGDEALGQQPSFPVPQMTLEQANAAEFNAMTFPPEAIDTMINQLLVSNDINSVASYFKLYMGHPAIRAAIINRPVDYQTILTKIGSAAPQPPQMQTQPQMPPLPPQIDEAALAGAAGQGVAPNNLMGALTGAMGAASGQSGNPMGALAGLAGAAGQSGNPMDVLGGLAGAAGQSGNPLGALMGSAKGFTPAGQAAEMAEAAKAGIGVAKEGLEMIKGVKGAEDAMGAATGAMGKMANTAGTAADAATAGIKAATMPLKFGEWASDIGQFGATTAQDAGKFGYESGKTLATEVGMKAAKQLGSQGLDLASGVLGKASSGILGSFDVAENALSGLGTKIVASANADTAERGSPVLRNLYSKRNAINRDISNTKTILYGKLKNFKVNIGCGAFGCKYSPTQIQTLIDNKQMELEAKAKEVLDKINELIPTYIASVRNASEDANQLKILTEQLMNEIKDESGELKSLEKEYSSFKKQIMQEIDEEIKNEIEKYQQTQQPPQNIPVAKAVEVQSAEPTKQEGGKTRRRHRRPRKSARTTRRRRVLTAREKLIRSYRGF